MNFAFRKGGSYLDSKRENKVATVMLPHILNGHFINSFMSYFFYTKRRNRLLVHFKNTTSHSMHLPYQMYFVSHKNVRQANCLVVCFNILEDRCLQKNKQ